ncbi:Hypothetical_protein [Hexamita inflata]|uniref:Hypothetical_protein n=1 Tax=Hexamita inflata TaxID=28002 RepID=A0ABP1GWX0_9EUKA
MSRIPFSIQFSYLLILRSWTKRSLSTFSFYIQDSSLESKTKDRQSGSIWFKRCEYENNFKSKTGSKFCTQLSLNSKLFSFFSSRSGSKNRIQFQFRFKTTRFFKQLKLFMSEIRFQLKSKQFKAVKRASSDKSDRELLLKSRYMSFIRPRPQIEFNVKFFTLSLRTRLGTRLKSRLATFRRNKCSTIPLKRSRKLTSNISASFQMRRTPFLQISEAAFSVIYSKYFLNMCSSQLFCNRSTLPAYLLYECSITFKSCFSLQSAPKQFRKSSQTGRYCQPMNSQQKSGCSIKPLIGNKSKMQFCAKSILVFWQIFFKSFTKIILLFLKSSYTRSVKSDKASKREIPLLRTSTCVSLLWFCMNDKSSSIISDIFKQVKLLNYYIFEQTIYGLVVVLHQKLSVLFPLLQLLFPSLAHCSLNN